MNKEEFINNLNYKRSTFIDPDQAEMLANLLDTVSSDIFSESQRFIFELIQNADDAALTDCNEIHFDFYSHSLIVSHQGKSFDEADIYGITNAGKGTKAADATKTGYKGIGFKSVFGKSNRVTIISNGYNFRFDRNKIRELFSEVKMPWQIIPIWTDLNEINGISLQKTYNVSTIIEPENSLNLKNELNELLSNGKILLFLRSITKISISTNGKLDYTIEKQIHKIEKSYDEVKLLKNEIELSSWIVKTFDKIPIDEETQIALKLDDKTPNKLKEAKFTEISLATKIENGRIKEIKGEESIMFAYLPMKKNDFAFPFLVNANFLTNASREGIHEDSVWNQWLFQLIGEKIFDWFELLSQSEYKFQILHLLPNKFNSIYNKLKISFDKSFEKNGKNKKFILNKCSKLKKASEILIDKTGLSNQDFIPNEAIFEYINRETGKNFSENSFIHPNLELKDRLIRLGVYTFDLKNILDFFKDKLFTTKIKVEQNINLIKYIKNKCDNDTEGIWFQNVKKLPFIFDQNNVLRKPKKDICFPSLINENELGDYYLINSIVFVEIEKNKSIYDWLKKIGVSEPSDINYIHNVIINNIENYITEDNYLQTTRFLFKLYNENKLDEEILSGLRKLKLKDQNGKFIEASKSFLPKVYKPITDFEGIINDIHYISEEYIDYEVNILRWNLFFKSIGVIDNIQIDTINYNNTLTELYSRTDYRWVDEQLKNAISQGGFGFGNSNIIDNIRIPTFIKHIEFNFEYAKLFWNYFFKNSVSALKLFEKAKFWYGIGNGENRWVHFVENYFPWFIRNIKCIPTSKKEICGIDEVFLNTNEIKLISGNYLQVLECDYIPDDDWLQHMPFKQKLEIEDYLTIIEKIGIDVEKHEELKNINKKRLGLIYNKLTSLISNLSEKKKNIISEWASSHKLLCDNGNFEDAKELKWVKIDGFTNTSEHLKLLFIPENCDTKSNDFKILLLLFGVQIIDSFIINFKNKEPIATLKIQLQLILPFFVAILERKHYVDYSIEFKRLSKIIAKTEFYNASEIVLSFKNQDEIVSGPSLNAYLNNKELSYKGKWTNPITLYALIPELLKLFNISDLNEELKLLIQLNESEIEEWSLEQGYDVNAIKKKPEYDLSIKNAKSYKDKNSIEQTSETLDISVINEYNALNKLLKSKNISIDQLESLIDMFDGDIEGLIGQGSSNDINKKAQYEENEKARELVMQKLTNEGYIFTQGIGQNSVVNGVYKNDVEFPLVVKSYKNSSYKFNIKPYEWLQLSKPNAMFWVHRGGGNLEYLELKGLLRANSEFFVRFETDTFSLEDLVNFASVFRFVRNVNFQLDSPNFSAAKAFEDYRFYERNLAIKQEGGDDIKMIE